ncbi:phosphoglycerate dehydrogenase-like enzyme [Agromyces hippuratus]|uniref:Phosphoglycerate dehydrogenase-like enzyme n=1 Tax=Agromyces hippuratus TaxID=286438 RepID=A0A852X0E5_9MICO|nr:2-hydroxyacid dehydrogenase [Agromyces hippuratus]NYG21980.1 phosphoglycerate dehydrogenase-like enzyme [Agromyces hippuratus]
MTDSPALLVTVPGATLRRALEQTPGGVPAGVEVVEWDLTGAPPADRIDLVVPPYMGAAARLAALDGVTTRLVQSQSIGYDDVPAALPAGHIFANAASVHETSTAELTLALILAAQRGIPDFVRAADEGRWAPARYESLADRRVLLLGYGGVGRAIEARLAPFEVELTRVASRARSDEQGFIRGIDELPTLLPKADIVIVGVPLTGTTTGLVDAAFLAALPDGALLVNIARGKVADTDAIIAEAVSGRLRFALDVTDPEPLPDGHPLFALPNVLVSPHVGGASTAMMPRMARLLREQIERMLRGDAPLNIVYRS